MDILVDQFDDVDATRRKMEEAKRAAAETFSSLVNATAAANGAGLLAIAGYLPTQELNLWLLTSLAVGGIIFTAGLYFAGAAKIALSHQLLSTSHSYRNKVQKQNSEKYFAPYVTEEDQQTFAKGYAHNANSFLSFQHDSESKRNRWASRSLVAFVLGFLVIASSMIAQKAKDLPSRSDIARCLAFETDMLRTRPIRKDSFALFQALGCKPQTELSFQQIQSPANGAR